MPPTPSVLFVIQAEKELESCADEFQKIVLQNLIDLVSEKKIVLTNSINPKDIFLEKK